MHASMQFVLRSAVVSACALAPWLGHAQTVVTPAVVPAVAPAMKGEGTATYRCGGVGTDESVAMRAEMKNHPLSLLFARASGAYLADVAVKVKDSAGATALEMTANGPVCLVNLPPGRYTVEAASDGMTKSQVVTLGNGSKTADFRF